MTSTPPVVYLLHGDDEFAIAQALSSFESKLGDAALGEMNTTRLDGRNYQPDSLTAAVSAIPFLADRRLVILIHPLVRLNSPAAREKFKAQLERVPPTAALILVENKLLTDEKSRRRGELHWLEKWAADQGERVYVKAFTVPRGQEMISWIQKYAKSAGGAITSQGAATLAALVGDEPRQVAQEVQKLLAYVNYKRPVDADDVEAITANTGQVDIFKMVDALGNRDGRGAIGMLHRLLEQQEPLLIFSMIIRQFRLLLLVREGLDSGMRGAEIAHRLKIHPYVADKISSQAQQFTLPTLEAVYRRLLDLDESIKTGQTPGDLALDTLVAAFTIEAQP